MRSRGGATLKAGIKMNPDLEKRKILYIILKKKCFDPYNKNLHTLALSSAEFSF